MRQCDIDRICATQAEPGSYFSSVFTQIAIHRHEGQFRRTEQRLHNPSRDRRLARAPADRATYFGQQQHRHNNAA